MSHTGLKSCLKVNDVACERDDRHLYRGVTMAIHSGELWHIKGVNGAGKTSLLRQIAGLLPLEMGTIAGFSAVTSLYIGHQLALKNHLTADENLAWLTALLHSSSRLERGQALAKSGLAGYENHMVGDLSAGQKRRVALARLHCQRAKIWLLDEPFTALDQAGIANQLSWFSEHLSQGGVVIMTSHQDINLPDVKVLQLDDYTTALDGAC